MEQSSLYNADNHDLAITSRENTTIHVSSVATFACPSDGLARPLDPNRTPYPGAAPPEEHAWRMVMTSYSGCFGSFNTSALPLLERRCHVAPQKIAENNGVFDGLATIGFASIRDGLGQTSLLAEKATITFGPNGSGGELYGWWVVGNLRGTLFTTMVRPNDFKAAKPTEPGRGWAGRVSASSLHPGGLNVAFADGSVRFIKETIDSWTMGPTDNRLASSSTQAAGGTHPAIGRPAEVGHARWRRNGFPR